MKIFLIASCVFVSACTSSPSPDTPQSTTAGPAILEQIQSKVVKNFDQNYTGSLGASLPIIMNVVNANGNLSGTYFYTSQGYDIPLFGKIAGSDVELFETDIDFNKIAVFRGKRDENSFKGTWENLKTNKKIPFELTATSKKVQAIPADLQGTYMLNAETIDPCNLALTITKTNTIYYYNLETNKRNKKGKLLINRGLEKDEIYLGFEGIPWDSYEGDVSKTDQQLSPPATITGLYEPGKISIQNYGNAMNSYTKLSECAGKFLILEKK